MDSRICFFLLSLTDDDSFDVDESVHWSDQANIDFFEPAMLEFDQWSGVD